jgi:hypothetical protein
MTYQLVDTFTGQVLSDYPKKAEAEKALGRMYNEPGEQRYEIKSPKKAKKVAENVQEESN